MNINRRFSDSERLCIALIHGDASALWWFRTPRLVFPSDWRDQYANSAFVRQLGIVGPEVLVSLLVAQLFKKVIPGHTSMIAGGNRFGFALGTLVMAFSTILGSQVAFWLARRCGLNVINRLASSTFIARWDRLVAYQGSVFFLSTFMLPIFPSDQICDIGGPGEISLRNFFVAFGLHLHFQLWLIVTAGLTILNFAWVVTSNPNHIADDSGPLCYAIVRWLVTRYLALFQLRSKVKGAINLPTGPKILAANHPNATDTFFLPCILPERLYALAQGNLFNLPIFGWLLSRAGQIPVWPERRALAYEKACELLRQGRTILIFPEGKLNPAQFPMQAGTGAVRMSLVTGAPIIPIGIYVADRDTFCLNFRSKTSSHTGRWQVRGWCSFQFGEAWDPSREEIPGGGLPAARYLTDLLMEKIYRLVHAASEEHEL